MGLADDLFIQTCRKIIDSGISDKGTAVRAHWPDGTPAFTYRTFGVVNRYNLAHEFPALTLRKVPLRTAVDELFWIWQRKSNNIHDLNSHIWDAWADEHGSIGKAYGYQLGVKHTYPEGEFDQVDRLLWDLKNNPGSRRMITNLYNHADLHAMHLYPCAYSVTCHVTRGRLNMILHQRSQDMLAANGWNVVQYAVLAHLLAHVSGLEAGEFLHEIADAHIYDRHVPLVEELIQKTPYNAPTLTFAKEKLDFYSFTPSDFKLKDYHYHPFTERIPIAI